MQVCFSANLAAPSVAFGMFSILFLLLYPLIEGRNAEWPLWMYVSIIASITLIARRGEEGLASGLINTSHQIGGPIGLAVLLTVANFITSVGTGQLTVHSASATVLGFGYAFLVAALLTVIGIIFTALLKQKHSQAGVAGTAVIVH